jgi:DedD protein
MAKQQKMDDEDSLKRRARRRLIGAVALTTVVVVVLPMVLDKEPRSVDQNIELRIPDKDKVGEFNPKMEPVPTEVPAVVSGEAPAVDDAAAAPAQAKPEPAKPETKAAAAATAKPAAKPVVDVLPAAVQSGFVLQFGAYSTELAAQDMQKKLSQQDIKAYIDKSGNISRVRVGPFKTREDADKVHAKLALQGLNPIVMPLK